MIDPGKVLAIARVNLLRQVRDRGDLFFVFVLPTIIIVALGLQFGGSGQARLGVVAPADDPEAAALVASLRADTQLEIRTIADEATLRDQVEHGELEAGLVVPDGFDAAVRDGQTGDVLYLSSSASLAGGLRTTVEAAIARLAAVATAARIAVAEDAGTFDAASVAARDTIDQVPGVSVDVSLVGEPGPFAGFSQFTLGATTQLILFMFLTSLTAAGRLVATRQLGVSRRMVSGPTSIGTIVTGEAVGRYLIALLQAVYIVVVTALIFGVSWGDPIAAGAIIGLFALVSAGMAMLVGAVARNADQAASIGVFLGLTLGALGGCMVPLQIMPAGMQTFARLLPHSWAVLGLQSLVRTTASGLPANVAALLPNLLVLAVYGVVVMALATWRFRRAIAG